MCKKGYIARKSSCVDVDECDSKSAYCDSNADCTNGVGNFTCTCRSGYFGDGKSCKGPDSVLVLYGLEPAILINTVLNYRQTLDCFTTEYSMTVSDYPSRSSCSITWKNKLYIFGGVHMTKIARLDGYRLKFLAKDLGFKHVEGACSVMNNKFIFLCFDNEQLQTCRRATDPLANFDKIALSKNHHYIAATTASTSKRAKK